MSERILVASEGGPGSVGALRMGLALARERGREVEVIAAVQPFPRYRLEGLAPFPEGYAVFEAVQAESLKLAVTGQLQEIGEEAARWPVVVETGKPATAIVRQAGKKEAGLIVVGAGRRAPMDRWLGNETALQVIRLASVPVLVAPHTVTALPRRALIAVDFSEHSLRAARAVLDLLGEQPRAFLVHMMWPAVEVEPFPSLEAWRRTYRQVAAARLEDLASQLRAERPLDVDCMVVDGDAAHEILGIASRMNVDVIAAGSHGYGFVGRLVLGSVSTRLVRGALCSVLIAPPEALPPELEPAPDPERP